MGRMIVSESTRQAMYLLKDAFLQDGFDVELTEFYTDPAEIRVSIAHHERGPLFNIWWRDEASFWVSDPEGLHQTACPGLESAVEYACDAYRVLPSWERERYRTLWQIILDEE